MQIEIKQNLIDECLEETKLALARAFNDIGMKARDYASDLTPTDTGHLKQSMTYVTKEVPGETLKVNKKGVASPSTGTTSEENCVYIGTNVYYAPYVEYGHRHPGWSYTGRHMIQHAIVDHQEEWAEILERELGELEAKYGKS